MTFYIKLTTLKNKFSFLFLFLVLNYSLFSQGGYNGQRWTFSYNPAYSYNFSEFLIHHKVEAGYTLNGKFKLALNMEKSQRFMNVNHHIMDKSIGLNVLYFRNKKGSYAPIGSYIGLGYSYVMQDLNMSLYLEEYEAVPEIFEKHPTHIISLYTGKNYIIYDHFFLGFGVQWGCPFGKYALTVNHFGKPYFNLGITL